MFAATDECGSNPCIYGECKPLHNRYECCCTLGYTGERCESGKIAIIHDIWPNFNYSLYCVILILQYSICNNFTSVLLSSLWVNINFVAQHVINHPLRYWEWLRERTSHRMRIDLSILPKLGANPGRTWYQRWLENKTIRWITCGPKRPTCVDPLTLVSRKATCFINCKGLKHIQYNLRGIEEIHYKLRRIEAYPM